MIMKRYGNLNGEVIKKYFKLYYVHVNEFNPIVLNFFEEEFGIKNEK